MAEESSGTDADTASEAGETSPSAQNRRVAVVTGAARGIGAHLARGFAAAGYTVVGSSRSGGRLEVQGADPIEVASVDVTDERAVHDWIASVRERVERIDVLVNNAGVIDDEVPLEESDPDQWWRSVEVNVRGPYLVTRMVLSGMLEAGAGRIININSGSGTRAGSVATAYNVGKSALGRITGSTHASGAGRGVYAFDLAPGVVRTDMTNAMAAHRDRTEWTEPGQVVELALALASGRLDAWSGRMVRAGADTPGDLAMRAAVGIPEQARTIALIPWGDDDPLAG
ncbi:SDR family oxidoreductase [Piscicoccus intestinalis]|uniref:SDR family oxidoreductase n=1 Tax=Piscicoccus intestinalis TaxID=746033 RepID=UPI000A07B831|nr:SDR family oxidoreductase [Piscicoccus intestinalis]